MKIRSISFLGAGIFILLMTHCESDITEFNTMGDLIKYVLDENNGFKITKDNQNQKLSVIYKPTDEVILQMIENEKKLTPGELDSLRNQYKKYIYFNVYVSKNSKSLTGNTNSLEEHGKLINHLAFNLKESVYAITSANDTLPLKDYLFPRLYGYGNDSQFLLVFNRPEYSNLDWIKIKFKDIIKEEIVFDTKKLMKEPVLRLLNIG